MRIGFKEWAVVVDALGAGQQILILRKGGISEGRRGFQVEHAEFLLFPTFFHQQREAVTPEWQVRYDQLAEAARDPSRVRVEWFAHVVSWRRLESLASVERLKGQHIWDEALIGKRFDWGVEKNIHALAVRVFRLPAPLDLPLLESYGGCKSWINLEDDVPTDGATPVLSKEEFNDKLNQFHAGLDLESPGEEPPS
jgi:hypothetical protein